MFCRNMSAPIILHLCDLTVMHSRQGKDRLRLALRMPTTPSVTTSTVLESRDEPLILDPLLSLSECVPVNITWTGGTAPYSLQVNLGASSMTIRQFDDILNTNFVWDTDVAAGTLVTIQIVDEQTVLQYIPEPIMIGAAPDSDTACAHSIVSLLPPSPTLSVASILDPTMVTEILTLSLTASGSTASPFPQSSATPTPWYVTGTQTPLSSPTSSAWYAYRQPAQRVSPNGVSTVFIVVGILAFVPLSIWLWWLHRANRRRKDRDSTYPASRSMALLEQRTYRLREARGGQRRTL